MFYLKPPTGITSLEGLETICTKRLEFLLQLDECNSAVQTKDLVELVSTMEGGDCLIEWTKKDRISHFLLRMACCNNQLMKTTFLKAEAALFQYRFTSMTEDELALFFTYTKRELRHIKCDSENQNFSQLITNTNILKSIIYPYEAKDLIKLYLECGHLESKCSSFLTLPFQFVTDLVAKRQVLLSSGVAMVPCDKLHCILKSLFCEILKSNLAIARSSLREVTKDVRIARLFKKLKIIFEKSHCISRPVFPYNVNTVNFDDVDRLAENFPLCMKLLHQNLREKHRLAHHSRVIYTLYLKEIGLTVHESLKFWKQEYSQPAKDDSTRDWQKKTKHYTYSIRHLYGLEGSRINYRAHTCQALQSISLSPRDVACCPFSHFDQSNLQTALDMEDIPQFIASNILDLSARKLWSDACGCYLSKSMNFFKKAVPVVQKEQGGTCCKDDDSVLQCLKETQEFFASESECKVKKEVEYQGLSPITEFEGEDEIFLLEKIKIEYEEGGEVQNTSGQTPEQKCQPSPTKLNEPVTNDSKLAPIHELSLKQIHGLKAMSDICVSGLEPTFMLNTSQPSGQFSQTCEQKPTNTNSDCKTASNKLSLNKLDVLAGVVSSDCDSDIKGALEHAYISKKDDEFQVFKTLTRKILKPADYFIAYTNLVEKLKDIGL
ncbi:uncharacterized protein LOC135499507 [Lineus longissimus]|uniref:uncharacterized protein LOC135499507 n=1 Tax=Lineus longissimus TaxID=88925 RepID=UPI002B4D992E